MSQTTTTPNYGLIKPNVNSDNDLWGDHWNANADTLDSKIKTIENKAGVVSFNTRSGTVSLLQADVTTVLPPSAATPAMDGTASAGTLLTWSKSDHIHPTDTTRYAASNPAGYVTAGGAATAAPVQSVATRTGAVVLTHNDLTDWAATLAPYAPLASPALTGSPTAPTVTPSTDNSTKLATTAFVQSAAGVPSSTAPVMNGTAAPGVATTLSRGDHVHPSDTSRAPLASPALTGSPTAPTPLPATDNSTNIATTAFVQTAVGTANHNVGRNLLHNPLFSVAQRGVGPWTASGAFTADRWAIGVGGSTLTVNVNAMTDADRAAIGDEAAQRSLGANCVGTGGAGDQAYLQHAIEGVRRLSGKTVTVSFYAVAASGAPKLGVNIYQWFGSGGSPSAFVAVAGQAATLGTAWARYSLTFAIPSTSGKTLGTNGDDATWLRIWQSSGSTNNANAGGIGVQSFVAALWGAQLEIGSVATPLEKPDPQYDLANCQRFYQSTGIAVQSYAGSAMPVYNAFYLTTAMRATPTAAFSSLTYGNASGLNLAAASTTLVNYGINATAAGWAYANGFVGLSADL